MIERSYDPTILDAAISLCPKEYDSLDSGEWLNNQNNIMFVEDGNVGLATFEYSGAYTTHWFFVKRGKEARDQAYRMLDKFFTEYDVKVLRGVTSLEKEFRGARLLAKLLGFKPQGYLEFPTGPHELMTLTLEDFYNKDEK